MTALVLRRRDVLALAALAAAPAAAQPAPPERAVPPVPGQTRQPLLIPGKRTLFQRVITRPGATLSASPGAAGGTPVPGFSVFYVYANAPAPSDAIEVGRAADGHTDGWISGAKTIEWQHAMVGAFTNPAGRQPVLFLATEEDARKVLVAADPAAEARRLRAAAASSDPGPVVAMEPVDRFVNIDEHFYLLPILTAHTVQPDIGGPQQVLEVVSAPAEATPTRPPAADALRNFRAGLVFLVDTTMSMEPYIDRTRDAIRATVSQIGHTAVADKFRFGLVAYRDSLADTAALEYATHVYAKPDFSKPPDSILSAIAGVQEARVSSTGFDEDPLGGLKTVLEDIDWHDLGGRFAVLITDAGARTSRHPHSITHMDIPEMRAKAQQAGVTIFVIHLLTEEGRRLGDHPHAEAQYMDLTRQNNGESLYLRVPNGSREAFSATVQQLVSGVLTQVSIITGVPVPQLATAATPPPRMQEQLRVVAEAARLAYLGRVEHAQPPDIVHGWTTDHDFADPTVTSLDVRVLLSRNQLSDLTAALQEILRAGRAMRVTPQNFFGQLQSAFATAARGVGIAGAATLGGLLGEYLDGLPYQSQIASIGESDWLAMGAVGQDNILAHVESCLAFYEDRQGRPDAWFDLGHNGQAGEAVTPIPLEQLP